ncbi:hypothetical protein H696_03657 [Fonticula alba]|uniref:Uncharacterized protein n=1 Tax=Fonticula alba TaxID=691883 RepID=A0A058Z7C2_FONAL|nr:hypothetical protein H696_03657 [Fonticula alba]KCV70199.1 hypothetical protein H696_03657 [Fonticula alba]|eukprot:XP_009495805.1 hypothetical protein H696_03657 [Fonticula alba]
MQPAHPQSQPETPTPASGSAPPPSAHFASTTKHDFQSGPYFASSRAFSSPRASILPSPAPFLQAIAKAKAALGEEDEEEYGYSSSAGSSESGADSSHSDSGSASEEGDPEDEEQEEEEEEDGHGGDDPASA